MNNLFAFISLKASSFFSSTCRLASAGSLSNVALTEYFGVETGQENIILFDSRVNSAPPYDGASSADLLL
jgi:hypothetical protein